MEPVPQIIKDVGFDFDWDSKKVWALNEPVEEMNIQELLWHFDVPFWDYIEDAYNLTPWEVIRDPKKYHIHFDMVRKADLLYPIDIMQNKGRWVILDGLHRLVQAYMRGDTTVAIRKIPRERIPEILRSQRYEQ